MCYKIPFLIRVLIKYITHFSSQFNPVKLKVLVAELGYEGVAWNHISPHFATHPYWLLSQPSLLSDVNQTCNISVPLREFFLSIFLLFLSLAGSKRACHTHTHTHMYTQLHILCYSNSGLCAYNSVGTYSLYQRFRCTHSLVFGTPIFCENKLLHMLKRVGLQT